MMKDEDAVKVHVVNASDMKAVATEEKEPEHFIFSTFVLQGIGTGNADEMPQYYLQILNLDPRRKSVSIMSLDNPIVLCHSEAQAMSPANQVAGLPDPDGIVILAGGTFSVNGTGPIWAVSTVTGNSRVSVASNRRGA